MSATGLALLFLVFVILVARPLVQKRRENELAEKLKSIRHPAEAAALLDGAMQAGKDERDFFTRVRHSYFFWL